jgi:hypothetical protein
VAGKKSRNPDAEKQNLKAVILRRASQLIRECGPENLRKEARLYGPVPYRHGLTSSQIVALAQAIAETLVDMGCYPKEAKGE